MSWSAASGRKDIETALRRIGGLPDPEVDPAETALLLAALDRPDAPLERYRHHLSLLRRDTADAAAAPGGNSLARRIEALTATLAGRYGYAGDAESYDDLQNANLMRVIDRRRGLPVALGILYIHVARSQGWPVAGLAFPGHFMIHLDGDGGRAVLDPFNGGQRREAAELRNMLKAVAGQEAELTPERVAPVGNREILLRLQNNIIQRHLRAQQPEQALQAVEASLMIAPAHAPLWREAGLLNAHLENLRAAMLSLEQFLQLSADPGQRHEAADLLQQLRGRLN